MRVIAAEPVSPTLRRIALAAADGSTLPAPPPGAHIVLTLPGGHRNAYSIVTPADHRRHYEIIVRRVPASRGGSAYIHDRLCVGDELDIDPPDTYFPLVASARHHLLIGGGIGVTPFLGHLPALAAMGASAEMHHLAHPSEVAVFGGLLPSHATIHAAEGRFDFAPILERQPLGTHLYTCGPAPMMNAVFAAAQALGWPGSALHREAFGPTGGAPFTLAFAHSGTRVAVGATQTMLEAIETAGLAIDHLCRGGACGRCITRVLAGVPDHRDDVLTADERASGQLVMPCVSRSFSGVLVLDL